MNFRNIQHIRVDLTKTGIAVDSFSKPCVIDVQGMSVATVQGHRLTGTWGTAVVDVKRCNEKPASNDAVYDMQTATSLNQNEMTDAIDVSGFAYLVLYVSTANGAACTADFSVYAQEF